MSEWKKVRLGDVCDILSSKRIFAKEYVREGVSFFRGKEIIEKQKGNKVSTELFITRERYEELKSKSGVPSKGDIILTSVGTLGVPWVVTNEKFYFKDGNLTWFRNFNNIDSTFLYYWILSPKAKDQIDQKCIGSTQRALTIETLRKFEINLPPLEEQERIAKILGSLDDKIEMNNKINRNLEAQAEALFKQWFVDFDFPDPSGNPYRTSGGAMIDSPMGTIPEGWRVGKLGDICAVVTKGTTPTTLKRNFTNTGVNFIKAESITDNHAIDSNKITFIDEETNNLLKRSIIEADDILFTIAGTIGRFCMVQDDITPANTNQAVAIIRADKNKISPYVLYSFFIGNWHNVFYASKVQQAVQANLSLTTIKDLPIILPNDSVLESYLSLIISIFVLLEQNVKECKRLSELRDSLLPKLMNNEIKI